MAATVALVIAGGIAAGVGLVSVPIAYGAVLILVLVGRALLRRRRLARGPGTDESPGADS